jgi:hypothetical protein
MVLIPQLLESNNIVAFAKRFGVDLNNAYFT